MRWSTFTDVTTSPAARNSVFSLFETLFQSIFHQLIASHFKFCIISNRSQYRIPAIYRRPFLRLDFSFLLQLNYTSMLCFLMGFLGYNWVPDVLTFWCDLDVLWPGESPNPSLVSGFTAPQTPQWDSSTRLSATVHSVSLSLLKLLDLNHHVLLFHVLH